MAITLSRICSYGLRIHISIRVRLVHVDYILNVRLIVEICRLYCVNKGIFFSECYYSNVILNKVFKIVFSFLSHNRFLSIFAITFRLDNYETSLLLYAISLKSWLQKC